MNLLANQPKVHSPAGEIANEDGLQGATPTTKDENLSVVGTRPTSIIENVQLS